jgi:hypothetical protein
MVLDRHAGEICDRRNQICEHLVMSFSRPAGWDPLAATAAAITAVMTSLYLALIRRQGGQPQVWFVVGLTVAELLCLYGIVRAAPARRPALAASAALLLLFGLLGLLSIGLPFIAAGVLAALAAGRGRESGTRPFAE